MSRNRQIAAAVVGNALEWYDFVVYGFFTLVISKNFFPASSEYASLLLTTATFGVGFLMRPVGGILIGLYADKKGRKAALQLIISLMTVSMAIMAFTPTYATIGVAAPLLMVIARLLQGLATGGEFASATAFLVEMAPIHRRGYFGSLQMLGQTLSVVLGALWGALVNQFFTIEQVNDYAFRLPFIFGLLIAPVGLYIRRHLDETEPFQAVKDEPFRFADLLQSHLRGMLVTGGLTVSLTITFYVLLVFMPTYANQYLYIPLSQGFWAQLLGLGVMTLTVLLSGLICDIMSRAWVLRLALGTFFLALYPLFSWTLDDPSLWRLSVMQMILSGCAGFAFGPISAAVAEQFPVHVRSTGISIGYNLAVMIFGGFATLIVTWLIKQTGSIISPVYYLMLGAALGFSASLFVKGERSFSHKTVSDPINLA